MSKQLFDPHGGFCVEPASNLRAVWTTDDDQAVQEYYAEPQQSVVRKKYHIFLTTQSLNVYPIKVCSNTQNREI
jgi:hypothetical protein